MTIYKIIHSVTMEYIMLYEDLNNIVEIEENKICHNIMTEEPKQLTKAQLRAKKYYETHKQQILEKAKAKRTLEKVEPEPEPEIKIVIPEKVLTYEDLIFVITNDPQIKDTTKEIYLKSLKRLNKLLQYDNYYALGGPNTTITIINEATQFGVNTRKLMYQTILKIIDMLDLKIDKEPYLEQFQLLKIKSVDENKVKQETIELPSFDKYIKDVQNKFGIDSKMYLLAMLYNEMTLRDDYNNLVIVDNVKKITADADKNYLYVPEEKGVCVLRINSYKTDKKYGIIHKTLSAKLTTLIKRYMTYNNTTYGDNLFANGVGHYISLKNKEINPAYEGISWLRHIKVSDLLNQKGISAEERLELSKTMMHSPNVQANYERGKKIKVTE